MLGKLLKHEFRATGRVMLPVCGAFVILAVLANLSIRYVNQVHGLLNVLFTLINVAFVCGIVVAVVITAVIMISRFYRSLLREQGYLMHTLPVTVHGHIWSKLIVSLVWFAATFLLVWFAIMLTVYINTGSGLGAMFAEMLTWSELREILAEEGVSSGDIILIAGELLCLVLIACLTLCLHFYAAMSLGHMFSGSKVFLSIVFFIAISIVFSTVQTLLGAKVAERDVMVSAVTVKQTITLLQTVIGQLLLVVLVRGAILYAATALGLKKGLNLA